MSLAGILQMLLTRLKRDLLSASRTSKVVCDGVEYEIMNYLSRNYKFCWRFQVFSVPIYAIFVLLQQGKTLFHDTKMKGVPRTRASIKKCAKKPTILKTKVFFCVCNPLFASIPLERVIIDLLPICSFICQIFQDCKTAELIRKTKIKLSPV